MYKLGIDVGGTNTDAVLIDENLNVVASVKQHTTSNVYSGIMDAIHVVLEQSGVDRCEIGQAMLGTTHCTNAIVERKNLASIGVMRIGAPASRGIPIMVDWAEDLKAVAIKTAIVGGGFEYDGKELAPFDVAAATAFFEELKVNGIKSVAISCVFSTVRNDHELEAAKLCKEIMGEDVHISISSEIGSMGLIERENATILNAALYKVAESFTEGFAQSLADEGVTNAQIYLSQNDGTLMTMEYARRYPILTIACGPTNSIRGASYLSQIKNAIVIDVGGTTTHLGVIQNPVLRLPLAACVLTSVCLTWFPSALAAALSSVKRRMALSLSALIPWAIRLLRRLCASAAMFALPPILPFAWVWLIWAIRPWLRVLTKSSLRKPWLLSGLYAKTPSML